MRCCANAHCRLSRISGGTSSSTGVDGYRAGSKQGDWDDSASSRHMITVCHPYDEMELAFLVCVLNREDIPYLIIGQNFGSLFPGVQISSYNERTIQVPECFAERAIEAINEFRKIDVRNEQTFTLTSKIRMLAEAVLFGWFFPAGTKKTSGKSPESTSSQSGAS